MDDIHLSRELLRAVNEGKLPRGVLDDIMAEHLLGRCSHCRAEVDAYEAERRAEPSAWGRMARTVSTLLESLISSKTRELSRAEQDLRELLRLPPEEQTRRVEHARGRFRSPALVRVLIEESHRRIPGKTAEARHFAELAGLVANRNPRMPSYFDLYVLARAHLAKAWRAGGNLQKAHQLFALEVVS